MKMKDLVIAENTFGTMYLRQKVGTMYLRQKVFFLKKFDFKELISSKLIIPVVIKILFCFDKLIRNYVKFW